jgi:hypothetical protein
MLTERSPVRADLEQQKVNRERSLSNNRDACEREYNYSTSNWGYKNSYIVKDGKVWSIYNNCYDGKSARPQYEYKGEINKVIRDNCGSLTQFKIKGSQLCTYFKGFSSEGIEESCNSRN